MKKTTKEAIINSLVNICSKHQESKSKNTPDENKRVKLLKPNEL